MRLKMVLVGFIAIVSIILFLKEAAHVYAQSGCGGCQVTCTMRDCPTPSNPDKQCRTCINGCDGCSTTSCGPQQYECSRGCCDVGSGSSCPCGTNSSGGCKTNCNSSGGCTPSWGGCSVSCGGGTQDDGCGGTQSCNTQACCDPNAWGGCSTSCGPGTQYNACGTPRGCQINDPNVWGEWGACSTTCGPGTQTRTNTCGTTQSQNCQINDPNVWGAWDGTCLSCGGPTSISHTNQCGQTTTTQCDNLHCVPIGNHDSSSCTVSTGWACDQDNYNTPLSVHLYAEGTSIGITPANLTREPAVGANCGGNSQHGFSFGTPFSLWTGTPYSISAYASNTPSGQAKLLDSPHTITCTPLPWWQVKDGDVQSGGDLASQVAYSKIFDLDGPGGFPGIPAYAGTLSPSITSANVSSKGWLVNSTPVNTKVYNYDYFASLIPTDITAVMNSVNPADVSGSLTSGSATHDTNSYYWYKYDGAVNSNQPLSIPTTDIGTRKVIVFVDNANVNVTGNINLTDGQGFFMVVVKGSINVDSAVGGTGPNLEGLYLADTSFTDGSGSTQLWLRGSLAASGGVTLQRDLGAGAANMTPAELFEYAPDQVMLFPKVLGTRKINWKEVAP